MQLSIITLSKTADILYSHEKRHIRENEVIMFQHLQVQTCPIIAVKGWPPANLTLHRLMLLTQLVLSFTGFLPTHYSQQKGVAHSISHNMTMYGDYKRIARNKLCK